MLLILRKIWYQS